MLIGKKEIDFGVVKEGSVPQQTIELTNMFSNNINITGATASCGCTKPYVKIGILEAGMSTNVTIGINTSGKKGAIKKTASISYTNNGIPEKYVITVKVTVE
jgi:hypothetical protein